MLTVTSAGKSHHSCVGTVSSKNAALQESCRSNTFLLCLLILCICLFLFIACICLSLYLSLSALCSEISPTVLWKQIIHQVHRCIFMMLPNDFYSSTVQKPRVEGGGLYSHSALTPVLSNHDFDEAPEKLNDLRTAAKPPTDPIVALVSFSLAALVFLLFPALTSKKCLSVVVYFLTLVCPWGFERGHLNESYFICE